MVLIARYACDLEVIFFWVIVLGTLELLFASFVRGGGEEEELSSVLPKLPEFGSTEEKSIEASERASEREGGREEKREKKKDEEEGRKEKRSERPRKGQEQLPLASELIHCKKASEDVHVHSLHEADGRRRRRGRRGGGAW